MKTKLIILDGAKGAGKSTISNLLKEKLHNTAFISLDLVRHLISKSKATDDFNKIIFDAIFSMTNSFLSNGVSAVIDSGINEDRFNILKKIVADNKADIFAYYLSAPKDVLWNRVQERDSKTSKTPSEERFNYIYEIQQSKDFSEFVEIDTTKQGPEEITDLIVAQLNT